MAIHHYAGYSIAMLVFFRLLWGFIGSKHARFTDFIVIPSALVLYLKQLRQGKAKRYIGHNPAGAFMIVVLLSSLLMTAFSGASLIATEGQGPLADTFLSSWSEDVLEEIHEFCANFTLSMIILHVGGVLFSSLLHKENLPRAMITGKKREDIDAVEEKENDQLRSEFS